MAIGPPPSTATALVFGVVRGQQLLSCHVGHQVAITDGGQKIVELAYAQLGEYPAQAPEVQIVDAEIGVAQGAIEELASQRDGFGALLLLERQPDCGTCPGRDDECQPIGIRAGIRRGDDLHALTALQLQ